MGGGGFQRLGGPEALGDRQNRMQFREAARLYHSRSRLARLAASRRRARPPRSPLCAALAFGLRLNEDVSIPGVRSIYPRRHSRLALTCRPHGPTLPAPLCSWFVQQAAPMPSPCPSPLVDIHCHLLPGIDDGAGDWDESLAMARLAAAEGIGTIVATPHQLGAYCGNEGRTIRALAAQLQQLLDQQGVPLRVVPGADVRIEPDLIRKIRSGEVLTLADRGRYVLLELPHEVYVPLDRLLADLGAAGLVGILSHPERNQGILGQPRVLDGLVQRGCLFQVTAGSLVGTFGAQIQEFAERLVTEGLVHFVATDAHGVKARRPLMRRAYQRLVELAGAETASELCSGNPNRVVENSTVARGRRRSSRGGLRAWFRWRKAG